MLYVHCGLPRTSTSSIQVALCRNQNKLELAGILYPDRWRTALGSGRLSSSHLALHEYLQESVRSASALDLFRSFLVGAPQAHVILSSEHLSFWLHSERQRGMLSRLLEVGREAMPVRLICVLRRVDERFESLYRLALKKGRSLPPAASLVRRDAGSIAEFSGMQRMEEALEGAVTYIKYERNGAHNAQLLSAMGIVGKLHAELVADLERGPRRNVSPSHKQIVALRNVEALSRQAGVEIDAPALREAFFREGFVFEDDGPCIVLDEDSRWNGHMYALMRAKEYGFTPYLEFYEAARMDCLSAPSSLDPDVITDRDLASLVTWLRHSTSREEVTR
jgi:hypothetical protein